MVNMSAKFDEDAHNSLVSIAFKRSKHDAQTDDEMDRTTKSLLLVYPLNKALRGDSKVVAIILCKKFF